MDPVETALRIASSDARNVLTVACLERKFNNFTHIRETFERVAPHHGFLKLNIVLRRNLEMLAESEVQAVEVHETAQVRSRTFYAWRLTDYGLWVQPLSAFSVVQGSALGLPMCELLPVPNAKAFMSGRARLSILEALTTREKSIADIARETGLETNTVSDHVRRLTEVGIAEYDAPRRSEERTTYSLAQGTTYAPEDTPRMRAIIVYMSQHPSSSVSKIAIKTGSTEGTVRNKFNTLSKRGVLEKGTYVIGESGVRLSSQLGVNVQESYVRPVRAYLEGRGGLVAESMNSPDLVSACDTVIRLAISTGYRDKMTTQEVYSRLEPVLAKGPKTNVEIAQAMGVFPHAMYKHLAALARAGKLAHEVRRGVGFYTLA